MPYSCEMNQTDKGSLDADRSGIFFKHPSMLLKKKALIQCDVQVKCMIRCV